MFTIDHIDAMADFFVGLSNFLENANERDIRLVSEILHGHELCNLDRFGLRFPRAVADVSAKFIREIDERERKSEEFELAQQPQLVKPAHKPAPRRKRKAA